MSVSTAQQWKVGNNLKGKNFFLFFSSASLIQSLSPRAEKRTGFTALRYHAGREATEKNIPSLYMMQV